MKFLVLLSLVCFILHVNADTPANCTYEEIRGAWTFYMGSSGFDRNIDCSSFEVKSKFHVKLTYPDIATDEFGNIGFWTLIYNQGFEVVLHGRKFFAFSKFTGTGDNATSICDETLPGWSHDLLVRDWSCYYGKKDEGVKAKISFQKSNAGMVDKVRWMTDPQLIDNINAMQTSWTATYYKEFDGLSMEEIHRMAGGIKSRIASRPHPAPASEEIKKAASQLPSSFDWRNVSGQNFVPAVRNQGGCGSCYAFSSLAMNEARLRIATNNSIQISLSPQDVVECSRYSQGCDGGFPYLIGGKLAEDYGLVEESCNPYTGLPGPCKTKPTCARHYSTRYEYVGGFYGACNEEAMKLALVEHGPLAVSFEVYQDFMNYHGGVYHHTGLMSPFNPFELTNHAVLLVGYGTDSATGVNYWTIKNSWGPSWGEAGFFRIRRGYDECAVESIAVQSFPIF